MTQQQPPRRSLLAWVFCALAIVALVGVWDSQQPEADRPGGGDSPTATDVDAATLPDGPSQPDASVRRDPALVPVTLAIPDIDVSTTLVRLGLEPDRTVEVPADADLAGWFRRGPEPGRAGSSVILGHVDSEEGPAVFARLHELEPGDRMTVVRADGTVVGFVVTKAVTYLNADFPAQLVYAAQGARRLNLVTCTGAYDPDRGGYQSNLVVYTRRTVGAEAG